MFLLGMYISKYKEITGDRVAFPIYSIYRLIDICYAACIENIRRIKSLNIGQRYSRFFSFPLSYN